MKSWPFAIFCVAGLAMAGCRAAPPAVALLEQENRELETRLYELADLVEDSRQENERLEERLKRDERDGGPPGLDSKDDAPEPLLDPALPEPDLDLPGDLQSPKVEMPSAAISGGEFLEKLSGRNTTMPDDDRLPAPPDEEALDWATTPDASIGEQEGQPTTDDVVPCQADNTQVAAITLCDRLTGGYDLDRRAGHEGIIAVIEPRDADGRLVPAAAPVSVVLLDPALPGDAARVARWELTAEEIAKRYRKTPLSEGIYLELVWPRALPIHSRLHMFVRYLTDDGRKLQGDRDIEIDVPALEARAPTPAVTAQSSRAPGRPTTEWQRRHAPATQLPSDEPIRTALVPRATSSPTTPSETSQSSSESSTRRRPAWSPDRP
ncbi:MAG TPA: hypothetical protein VMY37_36245 [Thermoguttaceae bacterium]|nr:hypothetical protein [Thermoguttaceae bacterium]